MILESILSCSCLLLACGTSIYTLVKQSFEEYKKLLPSLTIACLGFVAIGTRSLIVLIYKVFIKRYTFDPVLIEIEEKKDKLRVNIFDQILAGFSVASIIYSLFSHHDHYILGFGIIAGMSCLSVYRLKNFLDSESQDDPDSLNDSLYWFLITGYFSYHASNNYALAASYPYLLTSWALPAEGFYQDWTVKRTINDYMMTAFVILMAEALRPTKK